MTTANERKHLKIVIWTVLDLCGFVLDRTEGPGLTVRRKTLILRRRTRLRRSLHHLEPAEAFEWSYAWARRCKDVLRQCQM